MKLVFFEDEFYSNFWPITLSRPVYLLLLGTSRIYTKWVQALNAQGYSFLSRPYLTQGLFDETGKELNLSSRDVSTIFINGRFLPSAAAIVTIKGLKPGESLVSGETVLAFMLPENSTIQNAHGLTDLHAGGINEMRNSLKEISVDIKPLDYLWEMVELNGKFIEQEFTEIDAGFRANPKRKTSDSIVNIKGIVATAASARISPEVVLDTTTGPIIIDKGVVIEPLTYIKGPCYIGPNCRIVGGKIREGCSFGPVCRIGGEVEETILLGYDNKYHEGFLGHSYLGEWVNLGAMTTNSDLKNNYAPIKVNVGDKTIETGQIKVGCFIGDHTKTGIGTLLNTGISIGFSCNLYGGGLFVDRMIDSFSWGIPGNLVKYELQKAMQVAASSMSRRDIQFSPLHQSLFENIYRQSVWAKKERI